MKRAMLVLLAGMMTVGLAACKGKGTTEDASAKSAGKSYTISYNQNNENTTGMPDYQFLKGDISALLNYEARLYADIQLTLNDDNTYELVTDSYTMEGGERIKVGSSEGIGMVCIVSAEGTYEDNGDGTVTTFAPTRASYELETDIYSKDMIEAVNIGVVEGEQSGKYDSDKYSEILEWVPKTVFTLSDDGKIVSYTRADATGTVKADEEKTEENTEKITEKSTEKRTDKSTATELIVIPSDDQATTFTLYEDGTYRFYFESYNVEDLGTYIYDATSSTLTITDSSKAETVSVLDGDKAVFQYAYSQSADLKGGFSVAVSELTAALE